MHECTERIDVMLPFYGDADLFRTAVESVRAQTYPHWRLVCVDDAHPSTAAGDWLRTLDDPRIEYRRNEANLGVAGNFNHCLELVTASHFTMMGGDDEMLPDFLERLDERRRADPDAAVIQCGVEVIDAAGRRYRPLPDRIKALVRPRVDAERRVLGGEEMATSLSRADWAYFPSLLWRTDLARAHGFDPRFAIALDLGLLLDIAIAGGTMVVCDPVTFRYRRHRDSVSSATARDGGRFVQERDFFRHYETRLRAAGYTRAAAVTRRHLISRLNALSCIPGALLSKDVRAALKLARYALT